MAGGPIPLNRATVLPIDLSTLDLSKFGGPWGPGGLPLSSVMGMPTQGPIPLGWSFTPTPHPLRLPTGGYYAWHTQAWPTWPPPSGLPAFLTQRTPE